MAKERSDDADRRRSGRSQGRRCDTFIFSPFHFSHVSATCSYPQPHLRLEGGKEFTKNHSIPLRHRKSQSPKHTLLLVQIDFPNIHSVFTEFPEKSIWTGNNNRFSELDFMVSPGKTAADHDFEVAKWSFTQGVPPLRDCPRKSTFRPRSGFRAFIDRREVWIIVISVESTFRGFKRSVPGAPVHSK